MANKITDQVSETKGLGDLIEKALTRVGITSDRVTKWLGKECGCKERKERLNRLGNWARRILKGETKDAEEYLNKITNNDNE